MWLADSSPAAAFDFECDLDDASSTVALVDDVSGDSDDTPWTVSDCGGDVDSIARYLAAPGLVVAIDEVPRDDDGFCGVMVGI